jgi:hypothetical protein
MKPHLTSKKPFFPNFPPSTNKRLRELQKTQSDLYSYLITSDESQDWVHDMNPKFKKLFRESYDFKSRLMFWTRLLRECTMIMEPLFDQVCDFLGIINSPYQLAKFCEEEILHRVLNEHFDGDFGVFYSYWQPEIQKFFPFHVERQALDHYELAYVCVTDQWLQTYRPKALLDALHDFGVVDHEVEEFVSCAKQIPCASYMIESESEWQALSNSFVEPTFFHALAAHLIYDEDELWEFMEIEGSNFLDRIRHQAWVMYLKKTNLQFPFMETSNGEKSHAL